MNELFRAIPATDLCLDALIVADQNLEAAPRALLRELVTQFWDARREDIRAGRCRAAAQLNMEAQLPALLAYVRAGLRPRLRPVLNATGVVVHTNLGRSVLAEEAVKSAVQDYYERNNIPYDKSKFPKQEDCESCRMV